METKIVVYMKNNCKNCEEVKWVLNAAEVESEIRNIEENKKYVEWLADKNYMSVPVTVFPGGKELVGFEFGEFAKELGK
ncbi:glutaredoxin family protein [Bacillus cereus]|uniref:glutaredoxin family protein n=1 Tax=Bacillus cereus TaxID=1396 RepID=UPI000BF9138C|nr:glutaredoxin family protein [Bacillus cereus]PFI75677.1 NrdH-redoxin [Bacillus cereus]